jgi:hypothetical protein
MDPPRIWGQITEPNPATGAAGAASFPDHVYADDGTSTLLDIGEYDLRVLAGPDMRWR